MQTLIPQSAKGQGRPIGRLGAWLGFGLTPLALGLLCAGLLLAWPAFYHPRRIGFMLAWDGFLLLLILIDLLQLPHASDLAVTRTFLDSPQLGQPTRIELAVRQASDTVLDVRVTDDLHPALVAEPVAHRIEVFPREEALSVITIFPNVRGDFALRRVYLRYRGALRLVERWAAVLPVRTPEAARAEKPASALPLLAMIVCVGLGGWASTVLFRHSGSLFWTVITFAACAGVGYLLMYVLAGASAPDDVSHTQRVRVFPAHEDSRQNTQFYLLRARQIEMQKRKLRLRGVGRDFESLRDYQPGDELRNLSWTATARRGKLVTRQFTVERSQQVWMVLDAGRLSRTAFELQRGGVEHVAETEMERERAHLLTVTQLDQATTAATMLAQIIHGSGDKFGMMAYGRGVQQLLMPGAGASHVRLLIDLLSQTRSEAAEADHLNAVARLKTVQRRRGLIVWITELVDSAGRPELVTAASELVRRHLVVLVLLKHPELDALAGSTPKTRATMFHAAAAQEMLERRRETIAQLERQGVLIVETTAEEIGINAVSKYLEVKAKGLL
ncbi:MAG: DUF58 domain-containing protein [Acidobacteriota bacterium]